MGGLCGSFGTLSPCTLPWIRSNGPALPNARTPFIGSRDMISSRTTCARADVALDARRQTRKSGLMRVHLIRNLHREQQSAERLAVRVKGEGSGHAAAQRASDHEVQRSELRQLVARHISI